MQFGAVTRFSPHKHTSLHKHWVHKSVLKHFCHRSRSQGPRMTGSSYPYYIPIYIPNYIPNCIPNYSPNYSPTYIPKYAPQNIPNCIPKYILAESLPVSPIILCIYLSPKVDYSGGRGGKLDCRGAGRDVEGHTTLDKSRRMAGMEGKKGLGGRSKSWGPHHPHRQLLGSAAKR